MKVPGWVIPTSLATAVTLLNAFKPAVVDDTAYLLFARQIAAHPLDPYGFELFWYREPEPAMAILLPPVLPYWIAMGIALFGENLLLLKLWLFPFALGLSWSAQFLLKRFGRGSSNSALTLFMLGPAVLPLFNFMLDIPALALSASAIALFIRGVDRKNWFTVLLAGLTAGLAMQTKYTAFAVPVAMLGYGVLNRRITQAALVVMVAAAVFAAWELFLIAKYDESHFVHHVLEQQSTTARLSLSEKLALKRSLFQPMLNHLGLLALATGLAVGRAVGYSRWVVRGVGLLAILGVAAVCGLSLADSVLLRSSPSGSVRLDLPTLLFGVLGLAAVTSVLVAAVRPLFRSTKLRWRRSPDAWFLAGWLMLEISSYFALTPFPAARRVVPLCLPMLLIAHRLISSKSVHHPEVRPNRGLVAFGVALGIGLHALDCWDAQAERQLAQRAGDTIPRDKAATVWFQGHWGWQYYCDRAGMKLIDPGRSAFRVGDYLVLPEVPDRYGFYRPYHGGATFRFDETAVEPVAAFVWDDGLSAQTIPNLYGGNVPIHGRDHPRLRVVVHRVVKNWKPEYVRDE